MSELLIIGSHGQLARALRHLRPEAVFLDRSVMDLACPECIPGILEKYQPQAIINAAAYTHVDNAEKEEALAVRVNAEAPGQMARYCSDGNIPFAHVSSDYVFDGSGNVPWKETDTPRPLNAYGRSKAAGEQAVCAAAGRHLIFRTSWMYDAEGRNFPNTLLRLASEREELRVIDDQHGAPTWAPHLAQAMLSALETAAAMPEFPAGIYHVCNAGVTTWHGFAAALVAHVRHYDNALKVKNICPIPASDYPLPAKRPANSRLDCSKARTVFHLSLPDWRKGLEEYIKLKYNGNP